MAIGIFADEPTRFRSKKLWELAVLSINTAFFHATPDEAREILIEIAIDAVFLFNHCSTSVPVVMTFTSARKGRQRATS